MRILVWIVFGSLAAIWTGMAWLLGAGLEWAGALLGSGAAVDWAQVVVNWPLPNWLLPWVDVGLLQSLQMALMHTLQALQGAWPGIGQAVGWLVPLVWVGWGLGLLVLLLLALLCHWLVGRSQKPGGGSGAVVQPRTA